MRNFTLLFEIVCMKTYFASPFLLVFLSICLTNCQNEPASHAPKVEKKRIDFSDEFKDLVVFEQYVKKIDENKQLQKIQGLFFTDSEGNTNEATAWLDADMNIVKIKQIENLTSGKKYERTFYFCDGLKTVSQQITAHYERKSPYFFRGKKLLQYKRIRHCHVSTIFETRRCLLVSIVCWRKACVFTSNSLGHDQTFRRF